MLWSFIKFSQLILEGSVCRSVWRICIWILESKKLRQSNWFNGYTVYTVYSKNRNSVTWLSGWDASLPHFHFVATVRFSMVIMKPDIFQFLTLLFLILLTKDECKANSNHTSTKHEECAKHEELGKTLSCLHWTRISAAVNSLNNWVFNI